MNNSLYVISYLDLIWVISLVVIVTIFYSLWSLRPETIIHASIRMFVQLLLIGYILTYIFNSNDPVIICSILFLMLSFASYICLRPIKDKSIALYTRVFVAIAFAGITTLVLVTQCVVHLAPWYEPHYIIPLGGMIFANAMNSVSLAAERFESEITKTGDYFEARSIALHTSMIPILNSFFAVGLVSLPGMMTGQILSGLSPGVAAQYQIMVMCMIFGSGGIASIIYLSLIGKLYKIQV